jgi:general secretion pathway protein E
LVASSLTSILAQRLIREICPHCREQYEPLPEEVEEMALQADQIPDGGLWRGAGCSQCINTGYLGRTGIYELLMVSDSIRSTILKNPDSGTVRRVALSEGMRTLRQDGVLKVLGGVTTIEEVMRVTREENGHAVV